MACAWRVHGVCMWRVHSIPAHADGPMHVQMFLEDTFCELAERTGQRSVVLCDRGTTGGYNPSRQ